MSSFTTSPPLTPSALPPATRSPSNLSELVLSHILARPTPEILVSIFQSVTEGTIYLDESSINLLRQKIAERFPQMSSNYDHDTLRTALGHSYFERLFQVQTSREAEVQRFRTNTRTGSICEKSKTGWETVDVRNGGNLPYRALVSGVIFPVGVEISKRESYLCDEEFKEIFGMTKAEFNDLDKYVQVRLKKEKKLW